MDPTPEEEVQRQLEELQRQYVFSLPGWITEIEDAFFPAADPERMKQARRTLHDLAGNARTFGFAKVGEGAQNLLERFHRLPPGVQFPDGDENAIRNVLLAMHQAAALGPSGPIFFPQIRRSSVSRSAPSEDIPRTIGLILSDADLERNISTWLDGFGFSVRVFSGLAALGKATADPPDAVVLELRLADGDSPYPVADLLRSIPDAPPVVAISDRDDMRSRLFAVRAGAKAYFPKPLDVGFLVSTLDRLMPEREDEPIRVLIVDDASSLLVYHRTILVEAGMVVETLNEPLRTLETMERIRPDIVLMDLYMPECTGRELTSVIRQTEKFRGTPILFLSTETDIALQIEAMSPGGDGFLVKPILPDHLIESVRFRVRKSRFDEAMRNRDHLTGLPTHSSILARAQSAVEDAGRTGNPFSLALVDIDRFRELNGRFGHLVGDLALRNLSRYLVNRLGQGEIVGRYGGGTFLVLFPGTEEHESRLRLEGIRKDFQRVRHHGSTEVEFQVTFSAGVAAFGRKVTCASIIDDADDALGRAKEQGGNRVFQASG